MTTSSRFVTRRLSRTAGALLLPLVLAAAAPAAVLLQTGFETGYTAGALGGQSGGVNDTGFTGSWNTNTDGVFTVVSGGLDYSVSGGGAIAGGANALQYTYGTVATSTAPAYATISSVNANDIYVRLLIKQVTPSTATDFIYLWASNTAGANHNKDNNVGVFNDGLAAKVYGVTTATSALSNSDTNLLVAKFSKVDGAYRSVDFWLNPAFGDSTTPDANTTSSVGITSVSNLGFAFNNMTAAADYRFDSIVIGTTWADVVPAAVPEPSAYAAVAGLGVLGLVIVRRRRR